MSKRNAKQRSEPAAVTITDTDLGSEHAAERIRPLLAERDGEVHVTLEKEPVSDQYVDAVFGALMESAMAAGGRRLAAEWKNRLRVAGSAKGRAQLAMAGTINLDLRFGMLAPPLAAQAGCHTDVLRHEQQDADCIARLAVHGIATDSEVHKMRQRLVKRIVKAVVEDTRPQTLGVNRKDPGKADRRAPLRGSARSDDPRIV